MQLWCHQNEFNDFGGWGGADGAFAGKNYITFVKRYGTEEHREVEMGYIIVD